MQKYLVKAKTKKYGDLYYMNCIMVTEQKECAEVFINRKDAEVVAKNFKYHFHYEEPEIVIEEV